MKLPWVDPITLDALEAKGYVKFNGEYKLTKKGEQVMLEFLQNLANLG